VRKVIAAQIAGDKELDYKDAPILLWGPYLWANGEKPRKSDGLVYSPDDLAGDGTHPSISGRQKVAKLLLDFFTKDELAKMWFMREAK
jgi:lysophospholipase L1-like esterase